MLRDMEIKTVTKDCFQLCSVEMRRFGTHGCGRAVESEHSPALPRGGWADVARVWDRLATSFKVTRTQPLDPAIPSLVFVL